MGPACRGRGSVRGVHRAPKALGKPAHRSGRIPLGPLQRRFRGAEPAVRLLHGRHAGGAVVCGRPVRRHGASGGYGVAAGHRRRVGAQPARRRADRPHRRAKGVSGWRAYALRRRRSHVLSRCRLAAVAGGRVPRRTRMRRVAAHRAAYPVEPGRPAAAARAARQLAVHRGAPGLCRLRHVGHGAGYLGGAGDSRPRRPCRRAAGRA